jgi:hypothetical protein
MMFLIERFVKRDVQLSLIPLVGLNSHSSCSRRNNRRGINSPAHISSPLKWTERLI